MAPKQFFRIHRIYTGPNPYAATPVGVVTWDDAVLSQQPMMGGVEAMTAASEPLLAPVPFEWLEGLDQKRAIAEWLVSWAFAALTAERGHLNAHGTRDESGRLMSWIGYHDAGLSLNILDFASRSLSAFADKTIDVKDFGAKLRAALRACKEKHPDFQAKLLMEASDARSIPYLPVKAKRKTWQYGWGVNSMVAFETGVAESSFIFREIEHNKPAAKQFLRSIGLPIADGALVRSKDELNSVIEQVGFPCITKPSDGLQSKNVTVDINDEDALIKGFELAAAFGDAPVMVERMLKGELHRIMVLRGKFFCTACRTRPVVFGDGVSTVLELLEQREARRLADPIASTQVGKLQFDGHLDRNLKRQGLTLQSRVPKGMSVRLHDIAMRGTGADMSDLTDVTHETVRLMSESIGQAMRMPVVGIDYVTEDISKPPTQDCGFLEANAIPGLRNVLACGVSLDRFANEFFGPKTGRIPSVLTLTDDEETAGALARPSEGGVGWVRGLQSGVGPMVHVLETKSFAERAEALVLNPLTKSIDIAMPLKAMYKNGLPLDRFDRIAVLADEADIAEKWRPVLRAASGQAVHYGRSIARIN